MAVCVSVRLFLAWRLGGGVKRREFVAGGLAVACAGVAGAAGADRFGSGAARASEERPDRLDAAGDGTSAAADAGEAATLEVLSTASGETDVRLRLVRVRDDEAVHDRVRPLAYGERAHLSGLCAAGETYLFELAVAGATLVREPVEPGERAVYELLDETTVSVVA